MEKVCSEGVVSCAQIDKWPDFSVAADATFYPRNEEGFDSFISRHTDRELRHLSGLRVKNMLRNEWGCKTGNDGRRRNGSVLVYGIQWPPLQERGQSLCNDMARRSGSTLKLKNGGNRRSRRSAKQ